ncbi:helix-turn-helix domain-containing protein [Hamadaea tsunoensis]|uniref:helix-turn-helix domain-containing protein n=1 Tax=Hamadaea tsunoensis TaxID=53368 RepID=UPI00047F759A
MSRRSLPLAKMLTIDQLAELLQVPADTIYYWRTQGEGPRGHRIGRHVRFHEDDVREWIARQADKS